MKTKTLFSFFLIILFIGMGLLSCTKDDSTNGHLNYFTVAQEPQIDLAMGIITDSGLVADNVYHMHVQLVNKGYIVNPVTGIISGTGSGINFGFYSSADGGLAEGGYMFDDTKEAFTFNSGYVTEGYNLETGTGHIHQVVHGTVIVVQNGANYDFSFELLLDTGYKLVGTFNGDMKYIDAAP